MNQRKSVSMSPQNVDSNTWYYESYVSITVVRRIIINGKYIETQQFKIPKKMLKKSIERMDYRNKVKK